MSLTLEEALSAFRAKRSAHYSRAIAELGAREVESFSPPRERTNMGFQRAWLGLVADPKRRSWCLSTLMNQLPKLHEGKESAFGEKSYALIHRATLEGTA